MLKPRIAVAGISVAGIGLIILIAYQWHEEDEHKRWYYETRQMLKKLELYAPIYISKDEWANAVAWTINLHANCAASRSDISNHNKKWMFLQSLNIRLVGDINEVIINWIWSEYSQFTKNGPMYSEKYQPKMPIIH